LVLSLVLAPFATELTEKENIFFCVREGKDALALGNIITGAMVFQSTYAAAPRPSRCRPRSRRTVTIGTGRPLTVTTSTV
jgi:hypothetical protein